MKCFTFTGAAQPFKTGDRLRASAWFFPLQLVLWCSLALAVQGASDWDQWRGPQRNGVLPHSPALANAWPEEGLPLLWESEPIPGNDDGGHGSAVIAGDRVYLSVVWHSNIPSETRTISDLVMRQLGYQSVGSLSKELVAKMEADRESLSPQLRGKKLDDWVAQWIEENLTEKQRRGTTGYISARFRKGRLAIPLGDFDKLLKVQNKPFPSDADFRRWLDAQGFSEEVKRQVIEAVPPTQRVAEDVVICLDLATGKTLWKSASPGEPRGRGCSSTPAVADGKVYALGSTHVYCVDANTGQNVWSAPLPGKAPGSSPLVVDGAVLVNAGKLAAFDAESGKELWRLDRVGGNNSSPTAWQSEGGTIVLCNSRNDITAVDLKSGQVLWTTPGGGDSTPAIVGDTLVVQTRHANIGLVALRLTREGAESRWNFPRDAFRTQASPIIYDGFVYLMDDGYHYCLSLATGKVAWQHPVPSNISSPVLADGKLFVLINNGNNLLMLRATGAEREELGKANVRALSCPSPSIARGRVVLRLKDSVRCYDLTEGKRLSASAQ